MRLTSAFGRLLKTAAFGFIVCLSYPAGADSLRDVYERLLQDPGDTALNLRYAKLALEKGELRKALAAYERILARDPNNEDAKAGLARVQRLLKPDFTQFVVVTGAQFESNPRRYDSSVPRKRDGVFFGRLQITNERKFGDLRLRTIGDAFANAHINIRDLDFGFASVQSGPLVPAFSGWQLYPFVAGAYSWFDGNTFQWRGGVGVALENEGEGWLRSVGVRGDYSFIGQSFSSKDAYVIEVNARFVKSGAILKKGIVSVSPIYRYNGVQGKGDPNFGPLGDLYPLTYHQLGGRIDYFYQVAPVITLNVHFGAEYRHYFEQVTFEKKNRRDIFMAPGAQVIWTGLFKNRADVIFSYRFEYNTSNDSFQRYTNHILGVRMLWRFN